MQEHITTTKQMPITLHLTQHNSIACNKIWFTLITKKVSYRKQIARQHSYHQKFWLGLGVT